MALAITRSTHSSIHQQTNMLTYLFTLFFTFASQIQLYGFNKELYHNMSEAQHKAQGIVGISLMVQIGDTPNPELRIITSTFNKVLYKGEILARFLSFSNANFHLWAVLIARASWASKQTIFRRMFVDFKPR